MPRAREPNISLEDFQKEPDPYEGYGLIRVNPEPPYDKLIVSANGRRAYKKGIPVDERTGEPLEDEGSLGEDQALPIAPARPRKAHRRKAKRTRKAAAAVVAQVFPQE